ncbi:(+)-delta-cadinene synthase isozyme XC14-like [Hibiscus syriacus]|uniref:(+)-delta-cadinene synthase isozyme XC14-like n=1 Tax=Hibiscus syriacus TaxID=106335 RepID=UPI001921D682|nr:(+)-delta-cadinene synthase isozyme XC14-like [Hibiscus syriacus]
MASQVSQIPSSSPITATPSDKEEIRPKADFQPSIWGDLFLNCPDQEIDAQTRHRHEELKEAARKTIVAPMDNLSQKLTFIDAVQRLGVSYHFTEEINPIRSGRKNSLLVNNIHSTITTLYLSQKKYTIDYR